MWNTTPVTWVLATACSRALSPNLRWDTSPNSSTRYTGCLMPQFCRRNWPGRKKTAYSCQTFEHDNFHTCYTREHAMQKQSPVWDTCIYTLQHAYWISLIELSSRTGLCIVKPYNLFIAPDLEQVHTVKLYVPSVHGICHPWCCQQGHPSSSSRQCTPIQSLWRKAAPAGLVKWQGEEEEEKEGVRYNYESMSYAITSHTPFLFSNICWCSDSIATNSALSYYCT